MPIINAIFNVKLVNIVMKLVAQAYILIKIYTRKYLTNCNPKIASKFYYSAVNSISYNSI